MTKQITKTSKLHKNELSSIKKLTEIAGAYDQHKIKLYWNILQNRQTQELNDFLYYVDGNLVAYLSLFTFKINEAEISAVVHPKFRKQQIFKTLLEEAINELKKRGIANLLFICHQSASSWATYLKTLGAIYAYSQVEMRATKDPISKTLPEVTLTLAKPDDVVPLAKIGAASFDSPFLEVLQRFIENFRDRNRKAWFLSIDDEYVGKIHVRFEDHRTVFIHDLCVIPEKRGKNYAMAMILKIMNLLKLDGYKTFVLDVECDNAGALKLYEQCGFTITSAYDFWRLSAAAI